MSNFKKKMQDKKTVGNRAIPADDALGLVFKDSGKVISSVKISALQTNPYQPRKHMNQEELNGLAVSIHESGLLQPIIVAPINNNPKAFYIVAGHRRVEAHKLLNLEEIEAVIYNISELDLKIYSILENLQREELNPLDEAQAIKELVNGGMKQNEVADRLGKSESYVSKLLQVASLDQDLVDYINDNNIPVFVTILYEVANAKPGSQLGVFKHIEAKAMKRPEVISYIAEINGKEKKESHKKLSRGKFSGFSLKKDKNKVSFKLDIDIMKKEEKEEAIIALEDLLKQLKEL